MEETLKQEIAAINAAKRKNPELKPQATALISKMKAEIEGREPVAKERLGKIKKAFWAAAAALEEDDNGAN